MAFDESLNPLICYTSGITWVLLLSHSCPALTTATLCCLWCLLVISLVICLLTMNTESVQTTLSNEYIKIVLIIKDSPWPWVITWQRKHSVWTLLVETEIHGTRKQCSNLLLNSFGVHFCPNLLWIVTICLSLADCSGTQEVYGLVLLEMSFYSMCLGYLSYRWPLLWTLTLIMCFLLREMTLTGY